MFAFIFGRAIQWQDNKEPYPFVVGFAPLLVWTYLFQSITDKESTEDDDLAITEHALLEINTRHLRSLEFKSVDTLPPLSTPSVYHPVRKTPTRPFLFNLQKLVS